MPIGSRCSSCQESASPVHELLFGMTVSCRRDTVTAERSKRMFNHLLVKLVHASGGCNDIRIINGGQNERGKGGFNLRFMNLPSLLQEENRQRYGSCDKYAPEGWPYCKYVVAWVGLTSTRPFSS